MELLGPSLEHLLHFCGGKFRMHTALMIADQALSRLEYVHENGFIHRDLKPENLSIGRGSRDNTIYLLDFGLAKQYKDPRTGTHIPFRDGRQLTGTIRYASTNTHLGIEQSRRDDMESLGFVLVYFVVGRLPWQKLKCDNNAKHQDKVMKKKLATPMEQLCAKLPNEFLTYFKYVRSLKFEEKPNYKYLKHLFADLYHRKGFDKGFTFDWTNLSKFVFTVSP